MYRLIAILIGYILGSIQTAYFMGKKSGIDIREHGSKSAGFTNVNRVLGRRAGIVVFVLDILKAVLAYVVATLLFDGGGAFFSTAYVLPGLYAGLGAILGHNFPFYLKFKGGKGIACSLGLILMLDWRVAAIAFGLGFVVVFLSRYISLTSLTITLVAPILMFVFDYDVEAVAVTAALGVLAWFMHRENIKRLAKGEESKFSMRKR